MFLLLAVIPFGTILREVVASLEDVFAGHVAIAIVLVLKLTLITAALAVFVFPANPILRLLKSFVFLMAPLFLVNLISVGKLRMDAKAAKLTSIKQREASPPLPNRRCKVRLVVLIFDEFDQHLMFEDRPSSVHLQAIVRFREESVFASSAYPAADDTLLAVPSMTTGRLVRTANPVGPSKLKLTFTDNKSELWGEQANIFSTSANQGVRVGLVGWHHPYCGIFNATVDCHWEPISRVSVQEKYFDEVGFVKGSIQVFRKLANLFTLESYLGIAPSLPAGVAETELAKRQQLKSYIAILEKAMPMLRDPDLNFVFIHWPIPHPFGLYDREKNQFSLSSHVNYLDNLELVDQTFSQARRAIEAAGLWERTIVLVTGDHHFRRSEWRHPPWFDQAALMNGGVEHRRVPFLLKLAGQRAGTIYDRSFNLVLIHDLILALMREQVATPDQFKSWMDLNHSRFPADFKVHNAGP